MDEIQSYARVVLYVSANASRRKCSAVRKKINSSQFTVFIIQYVLTEY
jgi:hypothetical protein